MSLRAAREARDDARKLLRSGPDPSQQRQPADITAPLLLQVLQRIELRGANETAHTLRQTSGRVFRDGITTGRRERNPAADLQGALRPVIVTHMSAVLEPAGVEALMRDIAACGGQLLMRAALELSALLFQRPGNIRQMASREVDFDTKMCTIPAAKMKCTVSARTPWLRFAIDLQIETACCRSVLHTDRQLHHKADFRASTA